MGLRNIEFTVDINGISPGIVTNAGTQGDHRVTRLSFIFSDILNQEIDELGAEGDKVMYRFDVYDGEGGVWSSDAAELKDNEISIELEERHTRFGGKITVYLVITSLSADNETQVELYSFPAILQLKNRPEGTYQDGENYESVTGLAQKAKINADAAEKSNKELQLFAAEIEEKLKNGEFDGVGVESAEIVNNELVITYTDGTFENLGNVKGDTGPQGKKGDTGPAGKDAVIDQTFNGASENAQSGKALNNIFAQFDSRIQDAENYGIAAQEALKSYYTKDEVDNLDAVKYVMQDSDESVTLSDPSSNVFITLDNGILLSSINGVDVDSARVLNMADPIDSTDAATKGYVDSLGATQSVHVDGSYNIVLQDLGGNIRVEGQRLINVGTPIANADAATKGYVDGLVGNIEALLGGI